jgi:hypothetical protein
MAEHRAKILFRFLKSPAATPRASYEQIRDLIDGCRIEICKPWLAFRRHNAPLFSSMKGTWITLRYALSTFWLERNRGVLDIFPIDHRRTRMNEGA